MPTALKTWTVQPHETLEELDEGLLTVAGEIVMPLGRFPRRMTIVKLSGDRTAIFSAIALEEEEMAQIEALGQPEFMVVPSDHHRLDALIWKERYPDIKVLTPPGARKGVEEVVPVDATDDVLGDREVVFQTVPGTDGHESALLVRRPAGTSLMVTDVIAHVAHPHGIGANLMARMFGFGVKAPRVPKPVRAKIVTDPHALARQFRAWAAEPNLKRIVPAHGDIIDTNPAAVLDTLASSLED